MQKSATNILVDKKNKRIIENNPLSLKAKQEISIDEDNFEVEDVVVFENNSKWHPNFFHTDYILKGDRDKILRLIPTDTDLDFTIQILEQINVHALNDSPVLGEDVLKFEIKYSEAGNLLRTPQVYNRTNSNPMMFDAKATVLNENMDFHFISYWDYNRLDKEVIEYLYVELETRFRYLCGYDIDPSLLVAPIFNLH